LGLYHLSREIADIIEEELLYFEPFFFRELVREDYMIHFLPPLSDL
jgi:hypothetical protein